MKMSEVSVEDITQGLEDTAFGLVVDGGIIRDRDQLEEIVKRLTCHDELVEALEMIKASCEDDEAFHQHGFIFEIINKALAKAK